MDVAGTALAVASAAATTTLAITKLVIEARGLKEELEATQVELTSIDGVLFSIADIIHGNTYAGSAISAPLLQRLSDVVKRCEIAVAETASLVRRFARGGVRRTAQWFIAGKEEVTTMQSRLARCKQDLNVALSMLNISVSNSVHADTSQLLEGQDSMQRDVQQIIIGVRSLQDDHVKMDELLVLLRSLSSQATPNVMLDRFVNNLTDYAQTVYERSTVAGDGDLDAYAALPSRSPPASPSQIGDGPLKDLALSRVSPRDQSPVQGSQPSSTRTAALNGTPPSPHDIFWDYFFDNTVGSRANITQADEPLNSHSFAAGDTSQAAIKESYIIALPGASQLPGTPRTRHAEPVFEETRDDSGDLDEALLDATIRKMDMARVLGLLKAGASPNGKVARGICCSGGLIESPLRVALSNAADKDRLHEIIPIIEPLLQAGADIQWGDVPSCSANGGHSPILSWFIELVGTRLPHNRNPGLSSSSEFGKGSDDSKIYRDAPAVAYKLIQYGADPGHSNSRVTRPLWLAVQSYNPAMASFLAFQLGGVPKHHHLRDPFLQYFNLDGKLDIDRDTSLGMTILRNILIQHRHQQTSPWLRYLIASDERIGAVLLCLTMTLFAHPGPYKWNYRDLIVALFALISFDANPLIDVPISYQKYKPAYPSRQSSSSGTSRLVGRLSHRLAQTMPITTVSEMGSAWSMLYKRDIRGIMSPRSIGDIKRILKLSQVLSLEQRASMPWFKLR